MSWRRFATVLCALGAACANNRPPAPVSPAAPTTADAAPSSAPSGSASGAPAAALAAPEELCQRLQQLADADTSGAVPFSTEKCVKNLTDMRGEDPAGYACVARAVGNATDYLAALKSLPWCGKNKPQKEAPDPTEKADDH